jgi:hypothetical protein
MRWEFHGIFSGFLYRFLGFLTGQKTTLVKRYLPDSTAEKFAQFSQIFLGRFTGSNSRMQCSRNKGKGK